MLESRGFCTAAVAEATVRAQSWEPGSRDAPLTTASASLCLSLSVMTPSRSSGTVRSVLSFVSNAKDQRKRSLITIPLPSCSLPPSHLLQTPARLRMSAGLCKAEAWLALVQLPGQLPGKSRRCNAVCTGGCTKARSCNQGATPVQTPTCSEVRLSRTLLPWLFFWPPSQLLEAGTICLFRVCTAPGTVGGEYKGSITVLLSRGRRLAPPRGCCDICHGWLLFI